MIACVHVGTLWPGLTLGGFDFITHEPALWQRTDQRSGLEATPPCSHAFSIEEFFKDTPWLNVPLERQAILIPPLYPRGGLRGGSTNEAPSLSKLQALAAARKRKAQEQRTDTSSETASPVPESSNPNAEIPAGSQRTLPFRGRKDSTSPAESTNTSPVNQVEHSHSSFPEDRSQIDQAKPSAFASTILGNTDTSSSSPSTSELFTLPYTTNVAAPDTNPFAGPSPDDIVMAAQSKGSTAISSTKK